MKLKLNNGYNYISTSSVTIVITAESEVKCDFAVFWVGIEGV